MGGRAGFSLVLLACLALAAPSAAVDSYDQRALNADLEAVREQVSIGDWEGAVASLEALIASNERGAEVFSLFGFALRKSGRLSEAEDAYRQALQIEPDHRGALEYYGELLLETGRPAEARAQLRRLVESCGQCAEVRELETLIDAHQSTRGKEDSLLPQ